MKIWGYILYYNSDIAYLYIFFDIEGDIGIDTNIYKDIVQYLKVVGFVVQQLSSLPPDS